MCLAAAYGVYKRRTFGFVICLVLSLIAAAFAVFVAEPLGRGLLWPTFAFMLANGLALGSLRIVGPIRKLKMPSNFRVTQSPNPSIEGTRNGMPRMAIISFWAMRVLPLRAPHVKR
jgi:hypothetical protein